MRHWLLHRRNTVVASTLGKVCTHRQYNKSQEERDNEISAKQHNDIK